MSVRSLIHRNWLSVLFSILSLGVYGQDAGQVFYEQSVQKVLKTNCLACHSDRNSSSSFSLENRESVLKGGNRGASFDPQDLSNSVLLNAVRHQGDLKMPPGRKLKDEEIAILEKWVTLGVPMPAAVAKGKSPRETYWAFQSPVKARLPEVKNREWTKNPIDFFILARLEKENLVPSPVADLRIQLRRVHLDLTGLPPTHEEMQAFLSDKRPDAYERAVDRLLASPHYGERWGKHWLDIARYADTDGYTIDAPRDIWKYRDWVIQSLNKDQPYDQFVIEQLAGDLLPNPTTDQLVATGFHRNTPSNYEGGIDFEQYRVEAVADRVETTGQAFLGLTVGCARCHDHKFDPISQKEFYQLFAFFNNIDEVDREADRKFFNKPFLTLGTEEEKTAFDVWEKAVYKIEEDIRKREDMVSGSGENDAELKALREKLNEHRRKRPAFVRTMIMKELPQPRQTHIHLGGDFTRKGIPVQPGTLSVLPAMEAASSTPNRLDLAKWLVNGKNPLTARVTVNRMWQHYFGQGIIATENDFGKQADKATHPELLDWLAVEFVEKGWSQKALHRLIVTSASYRQSSNARSDAAAIDPGNHLLARQNRIRLDAEILRDASLVASGLLSEKVGGASVYPPLPAGANNVTQVKREWPVSAGEDRYRRGIYTFFQRSAGHPALLVFDAPEGTVSCTKRVRSNTPLQALISMNDESSIEFAEALSQKILSVKSGDEDRLKRGWQLVLNRNPDSKETERMIRFIKTRRDSKEEEERVWIAVSRVLLNTDEFLTRP